MTNKPSSKERAEEVTTEITEVIVKYTTRRRGGDSGEEQRHYVARVDLDKAGGVLWSTGSIQNKNPLPENVDWLDVDIDPDPPHHPKPKDVDGVCYYVGGSFYCS